MEKLIKNSNQSGNSIHQTGKASQMRCCSNYLTALLVKFNLNSKVCANSFQIQYANIQYTLE